MDLPERETGPEGQNGAIAQLSTACPPQPHHRRLAKQPHDTASHFVCEGQHDSDASHPKQSTARGRINKNQDYKAAATTTAGTAAARARLCAEPSAHVSRAIAPA